MRVHSTMTDLKTEKNIVHDNYDIVETTDLSKICQILN